MDKDIVFLAGIVVLITVLSTIFVINEAFQLQPLEQEVHPSNGNAKVRVSIIDPDALPPPPTNAEIKINIMRSEK